MRLPQRQRRRHRPQAEIVRLVDAYQESGLTQRAFAQRHGLAPATLSHWLQRRPPAKRSAPPPARPAFPALVPVTVVDPPLAPPAPFEVVLPNGRAIRVAPGFDAAALRQLLGVVED
ncbi:MAG: transposase [Planctomycetes bacterium]|nr:transposase [Planctomycetota bacterium]